MLREQRGGRPGNRTRKIHRSFVSLRMTEDDARIGLSLALLTLKNEFPRRQCDLSGSSRPHIASVIAAVKPLRHPKSGARPLEDLSELVVPVGAKFHEELYGYFSRQSDRNFLVGVAGVHGDIDRRSGHSAVLDVSIGEFPVNVD
jgi:hypothetical protein